jgi:hypothetical protein
MTIGIIGAGALGGNLARLFAKSGISATIANSRGPASLAALAEELGPSIKPVTAREAASADIVIVAVRWVDLPKILGGLGPWGNRIVVDATNPVEFLDPDSPDAKDPSNPLAIYGIKAIDLGDEHSSALFRRLVPGARVVKAFSHLDARAYAQQAPNEGHRVLFLSGDDAAAKAEVRKLIAATGHFALDLGPLDIGGPLSGLPFGPLATNNFVKI